MKESYSREAFEANEKEIDSNRDLAGLNPFGGRPVSMQGRDIGPGDIMSARFGYLAGKQKRQELLGLAEEEAIAENNRRDSLETHESQESF